MSKFQLKYQAFVLMIIHSLLVNKVTFREYISEKRKERVLFVQERKKKNACMLLLSSRLDFILANFQN